MEQIRSEENLVEGTIVRRRPSVDPDESPLGQVLTYERHDVIAVDVLDSEGQIIGSLTCWPGKP